MTLLNMVEEVQQVFPQVGRQQILFLLNHALRTFCFKTGILLTDDVLTKADDLVSEDATTGWVIYNLPVNVYEVLLVEELPRALYHIRDGDLEFYPPASDYDELHIRYTRIPTPLFSNTDSPGLPEEFHGVLVPMVISKLHQRSGNRELAREEIPTIKEYEREARIYVNTMPYRSVAAIAGGDVDYIIAHGTQDLVEGANVITLGKTFTSVNSFQFFPNGNGIEVNEYDPNNNHDQRTTTTVTVISAGVNTNFEFFAVGT